MKQTIVEITEDIELRVPVIYYLIKVKDEGYTVVENKDLKDFKYEKILKKSMFKEELLGIVNNINSGYSEKMAMLYYNG